MLFFDFRPRPWLVSLQSYGVQFIIWPFSSFCYGPFFAPSRAAFLRHPCLLNLSCPFSARFVIYRPFPVTSLIKCFRYTIFYNTFIHIYYITLGYAIDLPGQKSGVRAGFRPDSNRESHNICPPAGFRPAGGPILRLSLLESGRNPAWKPDFRPGTIIG